MSNLSAFFAQNVPTEVVEELVVSQRFKGKEEKPIPWKIRSMTEEENAALRKASMKKIKGKGGVYSQEIDFEEYTARLVATSVVFPELKNAELQQSYGVMGAEALLKKMLLPGEYTVLLQSVQSLNGFDKSEQDLIEEVKN
ncbi:phage portal protein [Paenibacillus selenitireducens]|uniref:Phage portal protein n=1 Tax=Paenibacillus selenitireducens TaxID=1324314 RepID=A0A1T2X9Q4_9BACL|nr:phage portal protein [Paenibacillus selenitireducens]OPA76621.1 phage portal protein [Paenibacillus selenitireducens]